ncbi:MAG: elongation factor P [Candidatus Nealsonbacteria bacterium]|nr:elongation factor P [Candidatus Nealsonbacteria bacterium]
MLTHTDLKKGVRIILDGQPCEILEANSMKKAQRRPVVQSKIKNLITGNVLERNFQQGEVFEEAELLKLKAKFLYSHREHYFFCEEENPSKRFDLVLEQIGEQAKFLRPNLPVEALIFEEKIISIILPIKIEMKVTEAPPGVQGDRAQGGTKAVTVESGAIVNVPLFVEEGDIIEINTDTGEYVKRVE